MGINPRRLSENVVLPSVFWEKPRADIEKITTNYTLNKTDFYGEKYGMGIVLAGNNTGIGRYEFA